jgi:inhibitor of cysteine peptidase
MQTRQLTMDDNGGHVAVRVGDEIDVVLPETPSTGYRWRLDGGSDTLSLLSNQYVVEDARPGRAGMHTWRFRAARKGQDDLRLHLEAGPGRPPAQNGAFDVQVTVADGPA